MEPVDYLLCESTYGGKEHHGQPHDEEALLRIIRKTCVEQKGKLLIPAFSVGRTQELVYMMDRLETHGQLPDIPVYVDSPLAVNATELFIMHAECYDDEILDLHGGRSESFRIQEIAFHQGQGSIESS